MKKATRDGFGEAFLKLGRRKKVIGLCADLTGSLRMDSFKEKYPDRFFQCGVAEQNMIGMATGLALEGFVPFVGTFGTFYHRMSDHIRISVGYNQANVKMVASHCGLITGEDGATHQELEDIAMVRAIPNIVVVAPCDYYETMKATEAMAGYEGAVYMRVAREKTEVMTSEKRKFDLFKADVLKKGEDLTIIGCGPILARAMHVADKLKDEGKKVEVINCHTIKPLDEKTILKSVEKTGKVLTIEEHQVNGGLGGAISELLSQEKPCKMKIMGVKDEFGESGEAEELLDKYGLSEKEIYKNCVKLMKEE